MIPIDGASGLDHAVRRRLRVYAVTGIQDNGRHDVGAGQDRTSRLPHACDHGFDHVRDVSDACDLLHAEALETILYETMRRLDVSCFKRGDDLINHVAANSMALFGAAGPSLISTNLTPGRILPRMVSNSGRNSALTRITSSSAWLMV